MFAIGPLQMFDLRRGQPKSCHSSFPQQNLAEVVPAGALISIFGSTPGQCHLAK